MPTRRRQSGQPAREPRQRAGGSSRVPDSPSPANAAPSPLDKRRHLDYRSGISPEELAARENVALPTILKSIERVKTYHAQFSAEAVEYATREVYLKQLGDATEVLSRALNATRHQPLTQIISKRDTISGEYYEEAVVTDEIVPDIPLQLEGMGALQKLLAAIQPKTPMVAVDARSQTNIANGSLVGGGGGGLGLGQGASQPLTLSAESIIRQVRQERGLALPSGAGGQAATAGAVTVLAPLIERDMELDAEEEDGEDGEGSVDSAEESSS